MPRFHSLKIRELRRETEDCVSLCFEVPQELKEAFGYLPGQHLTLRANIGGKELRRNYSLCSCPSENEWRIAVKKVPGGQFSTWANEKLQPGETLDVLPPTGKFTLEPDPGQARHYVAFAAGSGITPILSMLKEVLSREPKSVFTLFYVNQRTDTIIFREALALLKDIYLQRLSLHHLLTKEDPGDALHHGRLSPEKVKTIGAALVDFEDVDDFFVCGPAPMIQYLRNALSALGVPPRHIHSELFTSPSENDAARPVWTPPASEVTATITITLDGKTFSFEQSSSGMPILDAALAAGADLPFACKGGVCCTCKAKILKGAAEMEVNWGLEPEEVEKGYVLTCQAHPRSRELVLSFDE